MVATLWMYAKGNDVVKLQQLLNRHSSILTLVEDGFFGQNTYLAVKIFQRNSGLDDDGIVGLKTWQKLGLQEPHTNDSLDSSKVTNGVAIETPNFGVTETDEEFCFPFPKLPGQSWTNGGRQFGASRAGGTRKHAGCDLIFPSGTPIYAVADGMLLQNPYPFYSGTYAVEIKHGNIILRYGEIAPCSYTGGQTVKKGQVIAKVGLLHSGSSMLHLEIYTNGASSASLSTHAGDYRRRSDLTDPAPYLNVWKNNLPKL
ncbi:peptidoglycan DD-metalloendopeptidase family protein [Lelliottia sp. V106_10]|uniref:peptidoglycan DD-metalloendopeptidase family protein n=1 Tax=Lelliottia wanjuensis TaxID=3050585 RepID=UPI00254B9E22|nr:MULTISPECIES: peptidoglycan DD-metalloendopeptidase family protein [unclassified Lelliottia]MDK9354888.1 peptidoglycan DD-metalloendopeptidase family protein [Lelliottia sp. V106_16]MDK9372096.1 peptidoglycan DD-metalloendopeptidase family protein [Lelliottia sp. V106_10]MDK9598732.1 peptidoglycan DD-metalloendopeptidase family protein [Lelliottia sp. V106_5]